MRALAVMLCFSAPAMAQDIRFDIAPTARCVEEGGREKCIGKASGACMEATSDGYTTLGMSVCSDRELTWWDARLNRVYRDLKAELAAQDADMPDYAPDQEAALVEMQRAWIAFRDAKCLSEMALWGGGTGGGPAHVSCMMYETAEQTLYLETRFPMR
ncbi:lysozyme inhibitor LprI family protein [uncultured Roseovarius sp.]|uniref:lysozyme inhibitor LprI family protein n=1 Tax=uncultured Roseovarius sp. TaxID=293344 RepID=UPI0025DB5552|nr:lysozyme inhibitor LprI family protein [uncultured Roseovarius sp.]